MSVVVVIQQDPFSKQFKDRAARTKALSRAGTPVGYSHVRRPWRGISIKDDTWATLEVFDSKGSPLPFFDSAGSMMASDLADLLGNDEPDRLSPAIKEYLLALDSLPDRTTDQRELDNSVLRTLGLREETNAEIRKKADAEKRLRRADDQVKLQTGANAGFREEGILRGRKKFGAVKDHHAISLRYANFILTSAVEARQEKFQIMETFGDPFIFFFGEKPKIYQFSGLLLNSLDYQWRAEWWANYDNLIRGTRLVELDARVVLSWDDVVVEGYILTAQAADSDQQPHLIQLQFQLYVTNYHTSAPIGDANFPRPFSVSVDTSMWTDGGTNRVTSGQLPAFDELRNQNLLGEVGRASNQSIGPGFQSFIRQAADTLSRASFAQSLTTRFVSAYRAQFATVRRQLAALPSAQQIATSPQFEGRVVQTISSLPSTLDQDVNDFIEQQITSPARALIATQAGSVFSPPTYTVQDQDIIVQMTRQYARSTERRVPLLSGQSLYTPTRASSGKYRDNVDEFAEALSTVNPLSKTYDSSLTLKDRANSIDKILGAVLKTSSEAGVPLTEEPTRIGQTEQLEAGLLTRMTMASIDAPIKGSVGSPRPNAPSSFDVQQAQKASSTQARPDPSAQSPKAPIVPGSVPTPSGPLYPGLLVIKTVGSRPVAKTNTTEDEAAVSEFLRQNKRTLDEVA